MKNTCLKVTYMEKQKFFKTLRKMKVSSLCLFLSRILSTLEVTNPCFSDFQNPEGYLSFFFFFNSISLGSNRVQKNLSWCCQIVHALKAEVIGAFL